MRPSACRVVVNSTRRPSRSLPYSSRRHTGLLLLTTTALAATTFCSNLGASNAAMSTAAAVKVIDSHLHVWANEAQSATYPYVQEPPDTLKNEASVDALLQQMKRAGVDGALIVQPINHKYDHSYVAVEAMKAHPDKFKGMLLHDPSLDEAAALKRLEELANDNGFVGVRFNPYLWPKLEQTKWEPMSQGAGLAVYKRCGELGLPVGVMCFQGLNLHYDDIVQLLETSPQTTMILDHFGFTSVNKDETFQQLLSLKKYPQVYVKISALFRLDDSHPYPRVNQERFLPLLESFGADRLMYGSDFPFVILEEPKYDGALHLVTSWIASEADRKAILGGTAEKVFGSWDVAASKGNHAAAVTTSDAASSA